MTKYDLIDKILQRLDLGTWNGNEIFPRLPLNEPKRIQVFILRASVRDWRTVLHSQDNRFASGLSRDDLETFRRYVHTNFRLYAQKRTKNFSHTDFNEAELAMVETIRTIRKQYRLERM